MRPDEFQSQMGRLITQFGKNQYSDERTKLFWREVKDFSPSWWERTVDHLLLTCRQAPLQSDFSELIGRERERVWKYEKAQNAKDAKDFFQGTYHSDDVQTICQMIKKRLANGVSDSDYANFVWHLDSASRENPKVIAATRCQSCEDSGLMFHRDQDNYEWVYRCRCEAGAKKPKHYRVWEAA